MLTIYVMKYLKNNINFTKYLKKIISTWYLNIIFSIEKVRPLFRGYFNT